MSNPKITLRKIFGHFGTVLKHKWWVYQYARLLGIPWRGIKHDLSKFHPVEFWESVRYWDGKSSPIPRCKADRGHSLAWQHHKGHNPHHYEYWVDNLDQGGVPIKMPWNDLLELVADYLGAGRAYLGKRFTYTGEYQWWKKQLESGEKTKMHKSTKDMVEFMLYMFAKDPEYLRLFSQSIYAKVWRDRYEQMK